MAHITVTLTTRYSQGTLPSNPTPRPSGGSAVPGSSTPISMRTKKTTAIGWSTKKPGTGANKGKFLSNQVKISTFSCQNRLRSVNSYQARPRSVNSYHTRPGSGNSYQTLPRSVNS